MRTEQLEFVQFTYNVVDREAEDVLLPLAAERGIAVIINRPFEAGDAHRQVGTPRCRRGPPKSTARTGRSSC